MKKKISYTNYSIVLKRRNIILEEMRYGKRCMRV